MSETTTPTTERKSKGYAQTTVIGNLASNPICNTYNNRRKADVLVICNHVDKWKDPVTGEQKTKESKTVISVAFWGGAAETVEKYWTKGTKVFVAGRLTTDEWEEEITDPTTQQKRKETRSKQVVEAEDFYQMTTSDDTSEADKLKLIYQGVKRYIDANAQWASASVSSLVEAMQKEYLDTLDK